MPSAPAEERSPRRKRRSPGGQLLRSRLGALFRWLLPPAIVDGPKGTALVAKPGAVVLARATCLPIVQGTWWARPVLRVQSWDRTLVPLPFSRIVFAFGAPLYVAADATDADLEAHRLELAR